MIIEYAYHDIASNDTELREHLTKSVIYPIDNISVFPANLRLAKSIISSKTKLCATVDFPLGLHDIKSRLASTDFCIKNGANIIDIVAPSYYLSNRKYEKFREEIKTIKTLCNESNIQLRYITEYRTYSYELLYKVAQILLEFDINCMLASTGYGLDDISDNILACGLINKKVANINLIINGNIWNNHHIDLILKLKPYGLRLNSINALELLHKNNFF